METLLLNSQSKKLLTDHRVQSHLMKHEAVILDEMISAAENNSQTELDWFSGFGDSVRSILMNVHAHRKGSQFGFTDISFDKYGWFTRPGFQEIEDLIFGNPDRYGEHSVIHIGRGISDVWTYSLNYSFGTAGGGSALSVYGKRFSSRDEAFNCALIELKGMMTAKLNNSDTTNYKQPIILATLRDIMKAEVSRVQLTLF